MRILRNGSVFFIVGILVAFVPLPFNIYINDWRWWVIAMPLDLLISICISWRDNEIKQEILKGIVNGK